MPPAREQRQALFARLRHADVVLMEGTYGDRNHRSADDTLCELEEILAEAAADGGNLLIPAFAVGRTQELLFQLGVLYHEGKLHGWQVFFDSPMGGAVTEVYDQMRHDWHHKDRELMQKYSSRSLREFLPCLTITASVEESMMINKVKSGAIIIAGSGMCTGGRIRHHFKQRQLLEWAAAFENEPRFYLVHGEPRALEALAQALWREHHIEAIAATRGAGVHF